MTEEEWLECTDLRKVLTFLGTKATDRNLRLFACACCRRNWATLLSPEYREAVAVAEALVDGQADDAGREAKWHQIRSIHPIFRYMPDGVFHELFVSQECG